jgi:hypothetical protein
LQQSALALASHHDPGFVDIHYARDQYQACVAQGGLEIQATKPLISGCGVHRPSQEQDQKLNGNAMANKSIHSVCFGFHDSTELLPMDDSSTQDRRV